MSKRSPTTKDIALLHQLYKNAQLTWTSEFQRNAVWPGKAKAYLIDTILHDQPIPIFFLQRATSPQSGLNTYTVVDGQQRLRAIFDFLDDRFRLSQSSKNSSYYNKRFSALSNPEQERIRTYDLIVEELSGHSEAEIRDMFVRMNKYVVPLSSQELRHAREEGKFKDFVENLGALDFWKEHSVFSPKQFKRMRPVEFAAELSILLIEGAQDKKKAIDLYYVEYRASFPSSRKVESQLHEYLQWISKALPKLAVSRFRRPVDLYALIGALDLVSNHGSHLSRLDFTKAGKLLTDFERLTRVKAPTGTAARYIAAASRQTDNIIPRNTRIEILGNLLRSA
jgi:Protein of unknown function DUF262